MKMMKPEDELKKWIAHQHKGQLIKKTSQPYMNHLTAVAEMAAEALDFGYEIGLCHDLLEDTKATAAELLDALLKFGYIVEDADLITSCVVELTDVYTKSAYPGISKTDRKRMEAARLLNISAAAQTVKYADLIYNIRWVLKYDKKHSKKYLIKKRRLLMALNKGNNQLRLQALELVVAGLQPYQL
jgi:(p)ppGpp synthase/HD superfamily hydrolase